MYDVISSVSVKVLPPGAPARWRRSSPAVKRLLALVGVIKRLEDGQFVSNRSLARHLSADEFSEYLNLCQQQKILRDRFKTRPVAVDVYQQDLKRADFNYVQAMAYQEQGDADNARVFAELSIQQNQKNLLRLQQQAQQQVALHEWFDRSLTELNESELTPEQMPRIITSFSRFKRDNHSFALIEIDKQTLKLQAVTQAHGRLANSIACEESK